MQTKLPLTKIFTIQPSKTKISLKRRKEKSFLIIISYSYHNFVFILYHYSTNASNYKLTDTGYTQYMKKTPTVSKVKFYFIS